MTVEVYGKGWRWALEILTRFCCFLSFTFSLQSWKQWWAVKQFIGWNCCPPLWVDDGETGIPGLIIKHREVAELAKGSVSAALCRLWAAYWRGSPGTGTALVSNCAVVYQWFLCTCQHLKVRTRIHSSLQNVSGRTVGRFLQRCSFSLCNNRECWNCVVIILHLNFWQNQTSNNYDWIGLYK